MVRVDEELSAELLERAGRRWLRSWSPGRETTRGTFLGEKPPPVRLKDLYPERPWFLGSAA
jgi:hypothetical protein